MSEPPQPPDVTGREQHTVPALPRPYRRARRLVEGGDLAAARRRLATLADRATDPRLRALVINDLAVLAAREGEITTALNGFRSALELDPDCRPAQLNRAFLEADGGSDRGGSTAPGPARLSAVSTPEGEPAVPIRVAILSFLFNWPSTGGGIVHTVELSDFLQRAGYEVRHIFARFEPWGLGCVVDPLPYASELLEFDAATWNIPAIRDRFRRAVTSFDPDAVIITDSWNSKPILVEAVRGYPFFLRLQAMECLCPLNNVRLLIGAGGAVEQCPRNQLADPDACAACVDRNGARSGTLHQAERTLCGVGTAAYRETLVRAFREAEAVLVVNPLAEAMIGPYARRVLTVTAGMDPARFPWPWPVEPTDGRPEDGRAALLFAGLVSEPIKGFGVLHEACARLWRHRRDFELLITDDPPRRVDEFTRSVGWQGQRDLPRYLRAADVLVMPTIAQEALGRTAVEAMAAGRPVVASRLGGLPFTVVEGATGLLCEPGDPDDLARALATLLDDPALRERLGRAGRRRFEEHYTWPVIIDRHYRPLLRRRPRSPGSVAVAAPASTARDDARPARPPYDPLIPLNVDRRKLAADVARFFGREPGEVERQLQLYREVHEDRGYAATLGELKTLCFEEAFVLGVLMAMLRPRVIAEVGVQSGRSTRRILDLAGLLGLECRVVGFDSVDRRQFVTPREAELVVGDLTGRFQAQVLEAYRPDLVLLDIHPYPLLREAIAASLSAGGPAAIAIHDCGRGLCNPRMTLAREDPRVTSATGVWERHVLAELFGVADPLDDELDEAATATHRLRIFDTPHGLGLILPRLLIFGAAGAPGGGPESLRP